MKFHRVLALLEKFYFITIGRLDRMFDMFYWPILDIFTWGFFTFYVQYLSDINTMSILLGGLILWVFTWKGSQEVALFVLEDFWARNLYNTFTSPLKDSEIILANVLFGLLRTLVSFFFMLLIARLLYRYTIFEIPWHYLAILISGLTLFGWAIGLFIVGLIFRFGKRIQVFAWSAAWAVQPFSCVFYPLAALPQWAQNIAVWFPTTHMFEALRAILAGTPILWNNVIFAFILSLALMLCTAYFMVISLKKAKQSGILTRYD